MKFHLENCKYILIRLLYNYYKSSRANNKRYKSCEIRVILITEHRKSSIYRTNIDEYSCRTNIFRNRVNKVPYVVYL